MAIREENETQEKFSNKRNILIREDLEYSAQKLFTYATIGLTAIAVYSSVVYLVVQQLKSKNMTRNNENIENENSWTSWATGKLAMFAIGLAAGYFLYQSGILQKVTGKLFSKKESE